MPIAAGVPLVAAGDRQANRGPRWGLGPVAVSAACRRLVPAEEEQPEQQDERERDAHDPEEERDRDAALLILVQLDFVRHARKNEQIARQVTVVS